MMEIHRLPDGLARKIAAGEVIERPLSVVKELIENSLDANAKNIEIELVQGGKVLISVKDDGKGIIPEELPLAVEKHATSKINSEADLEAIVTLGYRGEALSSVCDVSHLEIFSRRAELPEGAALRFENGVAKVTSVPLRPGTTVVVKDLFYNLPARRKFLKSATAEFRRIFRLVQDYSFAYPSVAFSMIHGGKSVYKTSGSGSVKKLLEQIWGDDPEIRSAGHEAGALKIHAWWQDMGAQSRFQLISFINGRRVSDPVIRSAVQSFNWATRGNWLLMIALPPEDIDVNVHPAKAEILFRRSGEVFDLVRRAVERFARDYAPAPVLPAADAPDFLEKFDVRPQNLVSRQPYIPEREKNPFARVESPFFRAASPGHDKSQGVTERLPFTSYRSSEIGDSGAGGENESIPAYQTDDQTSNPAKDQASDQTVAPENAQNAGEPFGERGLTYLAQMAQGYLLFSDADGLLIVDPHAAHERINFEKIVKACSQPNGTERLIMPAPLPPTLRSDALAHREELAELRFLLTDGGELESLPMHAKAARLNPIELLRSALLAITERSEQSETLLNRFASKACKASVKLTTKLEPPEAMRLIAELQACDSPNACPHGRPTALRLSGSTLDKYFGRLGL